MPDENVQPNNNEAPAWKTALAGDNAEYSKALEGYKEPGEVFAKLTAEQTPADWRKLMAGENADELKGLERFTDAKAFYDSFKAKDAYINSGTKVTVPGEGASAEVLEAWNKARGVPDAPDGYQISAKAPEGLEIDEANKTLLAGITKELHALGAEPAIVNYAHEALYKQIAAQAAQQESNLAGAPKRAQAELSKVWKNEAEFKENIAWATAAAHQFVGAKGSPELAAFENLVIFDGENYSRAGDHPAVVRLLAQIGRVGAEDPLFLEASGAGQGAGSVQTQIDAIYALRSTDMKKYNAPETQAQLQKLLAAKARNRELQGRSAA